MNNDFVNFGDVARKQLGQQCQYACRYTGVGPGWFPEYPDLGQGLRFKGNIGDYHSLEIHKDDVAEFVRRYEEWTKAHSDW